MLYATSGVANAPCALGVSVLKTSSGVSVPLWADKKTDVAINIAYNGGVCYALLADGESEGAINIKYNDAVYHTIDDVNREYNLELIINARDSYGFGISAAGTFWIDWGDGTEEVIEKTDTEYVVYSHNYATNEVRTVKLGGKATAYGATSAISFSYLSFDISEMPVSPSSVLGVSGCLGCVFSTLPDGTQPSFKYTFKETHITQIPDNLFDGIDTNGLTPDFSGTFYYCQKLTGKSARINNRYLYDIWPVEYMSDMYVACTGLEDYSDMPERLIDD